MSKQPVSGKAGGALSSTVWLGVGRNASLIIMALAVCLLGLRLIAWMGESNSRLSAIEREQQNMAAWSVWLSDHQEEIEGIPKSK